MNALYFPDKNVTIDNFEEIKEFFSKKGVFCAEWQTEPYLSGEADSGVVLKTYKHYIDPFMKICGYTSADVVCVNSKTPGIDDLRQKFIKEHIHTDNEIRFIVKGSGTFWFNLEKDEPIFSLRCSPGVVISVPANTKHWFDIGKNPSFIAIRIFKEKEGWEAIYTNSGIEKKYCG